MLPVSLSPRLRPFLAAFLLSQVPSALRADESPDLAAARALQPTAAEMDAEPSNLGGGLRQLAAIARKSGVATQTDARRRAAVLGAHRRVTVPRAQADAAGRVVADVRVKEAGSTESVRANLLALGADVLAEAPAGAVPGRRGGVLTVSLPPERAAEAARGAGVHSISLIHRPWKRVGRATSQGVNAISSPAVNARGYTGRGITVGVLSDSFDLVSPHAATDILNDDLPGPRNPAGRTKPVNVVREGDRTDSFNEDEGRALLQIIHDVAPDAALAFSSIGSSQTTFASAIFSLRNLAACDVLVDDIAFPDEPFFSDGVISQAVDEVVTRTSAPGRRVIFYSAAGNDGDVGYEADFRPYPDSLARAGGTPVGNLRLDQVPRELTAGGFHNFKGTLKGHGSGIVQRVTVSGDLTEIDLQWNDPFGDGRATTDYNLLVFDANGNYLPDLSGTDNSFDTGDAYEIVDLDTNADGSDRVYQLAIARRAGGSGQANHFRYVASTAGQFVSKYVRPGVPTIFGHTAARNSDAVGAFDVANLKVPESFTSFGPVRVDFDANGNRLPAPEIRLQPTVSGPDGVNTSFFPADAGSDTDGDGLPNFYGTSAAAPHVAGVAALLLQANGGPGSLSPEQMRDLLTSTAAAHDLDPNLSAAHLVNGDGVTAVSLTANGDDSNNGSFDNKFFTLRYESGLENTSLRTVTIDLAKVSEQFDPSTDKGYPFTIGQAVNVTPAAVTATVSSVAGAPTPNSRLTLTFLPGSFAPGALLAFGLDRDTAAGSGGNGADILNGAAIKIRFNLPDGTTGKLKGSLNSNIGTGYSPDVGYGLINAEAALNRLGR